jgi:hypothetical protein
LEQIGLLNSLVQAAFYIDAGRKGLATTGEEAQGHINFDDGISGALAAFQEVSDFQSATTADPQTPTLAELVFLQQELQFCHEADTDTRSSLTQAIQSFRDALRCLKTVENQALYQGAETTHPTAAKYRIQGLPKDAVHLACIAHRTRLRNSLRTPGINMIEKAVLQQRASNMTAVQKSYVQLQKKALGISNEEGHLG